ncbi:BRO family protein [Streptococcus suis]|uniref:BRO family protein n=1 Tax=Streptococcus suis TaxID=1307 RepID=UPI001ABDA24D|nr:phage antirepressor KilAC domain-containing protein [Streptococcus suis]HEM4768954.1 phage antirepressor KilAC domain-containing protein [Streptococcus suis]
MHEIYNFHGQEVRTLTIDNEPYFVGKDVAEILAYKEPNKAITRHVDEEDRTKHPIPTKGGTQDSYIINESGLYSLILSSKLPQAKEFKRWVTSEVLPAIRKHGMFATDELLDNPDFAIATLQKLKEEREERKRLEVVNSQLAVENQIMQPKAQYFDDLVDRNLLTNFRDTAKMLKVKQKEFIDFLLSKKYIFRDKKGKLMPYQQYNNSLFEIKESKGVDWEGVQTLITPRGRETFNILLNS